MWHRYRGFADKLKEVWGEAVAGSSSLADSLDRCAEGLDKCNRTEFGNVKKKIKELKDNLLSLAKVLRTSSVVDKERKLRDKIDEFRPGKIIHQPLSVRLLEQLANSVPCGADESRNTEEAAANGGGNCLTPRGKRFRIPEIETCPPEPKKIRRMNTSPCTKLKRPPIAFFFLHLS
ncbi:hypothetical protein QQ045_015324 [Rhodiola kirilowii]